MPAAPNERHDTYFLGLDLGQAVDFSALCALRRRPVVSERGLEHTYTIRGLKRWPLGTLYTTIVCDVVAIAHQPPLANCILGVDRTGCGSPCVDLLRAAAPHANLRPVLITAGFETSHVNRDYHVPKRELVAVLQLVLQSRRLEIPANLPAQPDLERELMAFRARIVAKTGHESFEADWRTRAHDDLVLAVAIALWLGERESPVVDVPLNELILDDRRRGRFFM